MENTTVTSVELSAKPGATEVDAIIDGLKISLNEWRNVNVRHNGKVFFIKANDLILVAKEKKND